MRLLDIESGPLIMEGDSAEVGFQHGTYLGPMIRSFLGDNVARLGYSMSDLKLTRATAFASLNRDFIRKYLPHRYDELFSLAEGAKVSMDEVLLLQYRREISRLYGAFESSDCSSMTVRAAGGLILAQTIDLSCNMADLGVPLLVKQKNGLPNVAMYTFAGLIGYLGMNSEGLAVLINMVVGGDWGPGISPYIMARELLDKKSIDECIQFIQNVPASSSRSFIISDSARTVIVEFVPGCVKVLEADLPIHTNHFQDQDLAKCDELSVFAKHSSMRRYNKLELLSGELCGGDFNEVMDSFNCHDGYPVGLCMHSDGVVTRAETVATVCMQPSTGFFSFQKGPPCECQQRFSFNIFF